MTTPKQTVEAKVWPPFSDESAKKAVFHLRSALAPSPKEAPKGEAIKIVNRTAMDCNERHCHCHDEKEGRTFCTSDMTTCHHCHPELYENKPPAPDKEWEHKWGVLLMDIFLKSKPKAQRFPIGQLEKRGIEFIRSLLLSKDQEADRRVSEAIDLLDKFESQCGCGYGVCMPVETLKEELKKLSQDKRKLSSK